MYKRAHQAVIWWSCAEADDDINNNGDGEDDQSNVEGMDLLEDHRPFVFTPTCGFWKHNAADYVCNTQGYAD